MYVYVSWEDGGDDAPGALRISLMGWNKESIYTDYAVLGKGNKITD